MTASTYQNMAPLPEALERALLEVPATAMLRELKWLGVSTKYALVQEIARRMKEKAVRAFLAQDHSAETDALSLMIGEVRPVPRPRAPDPAGQNSWEKPSAPKTPRAIAANNDTLVELSTGRTRIQPGSLRQKLLDALKAAGGRAALSALSEALGCNAKPIVAKLREAGWVK